MNFPNVIFSGSIDHAIGWAVLHSIWQITLWAVLAGLMLYGLRRHSAALRYKVANATLLLIFLTVLGTFYWEMQSQEAQWLELKSAISNVPATPAKPEAALVKQSTPALVAAQPRPITLSKNWSDYFFEHQPLVVLIWLLGLAVGLFRLMGSWSFVQLLRVRMNFPVDPYWYETLENLTKRAGFSRKIALYESALVRSPLTIGWLQPAILFPVGIINRLSLEEVEAILAHELAHIFRHDYLFNLLQGLVETLFYYHPAIWWLSAQVRNEREHACDDLAIAWLGNKLNYAKALVAMQEMAFFPQTASLAFMGTGKGQLLTRIHRLFSPSTYTFNMMEKWIATFLVAFSVAALAISQGTLGHAPKNDLTTSVTTHGGPDSGLWQAEFFKDSVCLNLSSGQRNQHWMLGDCFLQTDFAGLKPTPGDVNVQIKRAAGTLQMTGKMENAAGFGRFEFKPDAQYVEMLRQEGIAMTEEGLLFHLFWADFPIDYVKSMKKAGFQNLTDEVLIQLAVFKINLQEAEKLEKMWSSMEKTSINAEDLVQMKIAAVTPEKIKSYTKAGLGELNMESVINLSLQNIDLNYIQSLSQLGFTNLDPGEISGAKAIGISSEYINEMKALNMEASSLGDLMGLKSLGIDASEIKRMQQIGLGELSLEHIMAIKSLGADAAYIEKMQAIGLGKSAEEVIMLKSQDIDPEFVQQANSWGLGKLEGEDYLQLKVHNITPAFINQFTEMGFKNLTLEDLVAARIHDITPKFIKDAENQGYKFPNLGEYADLKIRQQAFPKGN